MTAFSITADHQPVIEALNRLAYAFTPQGMRPVMRAIGETITASTKRRFEKSIAPDGTGWAPLAASTVLARINRKTSKQRVSAGTKPLIDTGQLSETINYQIIDGGATVVIGTNRNFGKATAAVHQFGTTNAGRGHNVVIPARPFLGISAMDEITVIDLIETFIAKSMP